MQMPLRRASRSFTFVNTSPPEERPILLKSLDILKELPDDCEDIHCTNTIMRYAQRPSSLENLCCSDFAALYDLKTTYKKKQTSKANDLPEDTMQDNRDDDPYSSDNCDTNPTDKITLDNGDIMRKRQNRKILRYVRYSKEKDPDNYYRERLLLFYPWRQEECLKQDLQTYEERYSEVQEEIVQKQKEYEYNVDEFDKAKKLQEQMDLQDDDEGLCDSVAPNTGHLNQKDQFDSQHTLSNYIPLEDHHTEYDTGIEYGLHIAAGSDATEELLTNRMNDADYRSLVRSLNKKQKEIFFHVVKKVKTSSEHFFLFLSGGAGVGKTCVTNALYQALVRYYNQDQGSNPQQASVLLTAPTGKAAYLIKGSTIHSAFGIPCNQSLTYKPLTSSNLNTMRTKLSGLKVLVIDEISMCGYRLLNFIHLRLQDVLGSNKPFGGITVIGVGDLFQLHPVLDSWIFSPPDQDYALLAPNLWKENFKLFELTEVMRQKDDQSFAKLLNRLREGKQTEEDNNVLCTRIINSNSSDYPTTSTHMMYQNTPVMQHNDNVYNHATTPKMTQTAADIVVGDIPNSAKQKILAKSPSKPGDAMGLGKVVKTAVGLRNELTVNLDVEDGLTNGAPCTTMHIEQGVIWVKFDEDSIGSKARAENLQLYGTTVDRTWVPIKPIRREFAAGKYRNAKINRLQYPLQLAAAKTIHKCQGATMESAVIQLPPKALPHLHYVAFSRVTKLANLFIKDLNTSNIAVDEKVQQEMARLRTSAEVDLCNTSLYTLPDNLLKLYFHNVQSLHLHHGDVAADYNVQSADVCLFVETKLCTSDSDAAYSLNGFTLFRNDFQPNRTPYGSCVYYKSNLTCQCMALNDSNIEITVLTVDTLVQIVLVYCRNKERLAQIEAAFVNLRKILHNTLPTVITGDFNINAQPPTSKKFTQLAAIMFNHFGCRQLMHEYTTDKQTTIDLIFSNIETSNLQVGTLESY